MKIQVRKKEDVVILDLEGSINVNAANFVETVGKILDGEIKNIICNFESVNLIDYVGVSLIAVIYKNVLNKKGKIKLYAVPSHIINLFSIVGFDRIFEYYVSEEQALCAIKADRKEERILNH